MAQTRAQIKRKVVQDAANELLNAKVIVDDLLGIVGKLATVPVFRGLATVLARPVTRLHEVVSLASRLMEDMLDNSTPPAGLRYA